MSVNARRYSIPALVAIAFVVAAAVPFTVEAGSADYKHTGSLTLLTDNGGRLDWSHDGNWIYFDRENLVEGSNCYQLYRIGLDGEDPPELLTEDFATVNLHHGNPVEHPSGNFLVFQAQEANTGPCVDRASPGKGVDNELWVLDLQGESYTFHRLTDNSLGVLHPQFSHDGTKLFWAENHGTLGLDWRLAVAPFLTGTAACGQDIEFCLGTICRFEPTETNGQFYESHGFGPDDDWLYYSCSRGPSLTGGAAWDICRSDMPQSCDTPEAAPLTRTNGDNPELSSWDEHAKLSPLGDAMV